MLVKTPQLSYMTALALLLYLSLSCNNDSDLFYEVVSEQIEEEEEIDDESGNNEQNITSREFNDLTIQSIEDETISIDMGNSSSDRGKFSEFTKVSASKAGNVVMKSNDSITYTPEADYNGGDSFTAEAKMIDQDGNTITEEITIDISIDAVSDVQDDTYNTEINNSIRLNVLGNDNFENEGVTIARTSDPSMGTVRINQDNTLTYTPNTDETGEDTFTYTTQITFKDGSINNETANVNISIRDNSNNSSSSEELKAFPTAEGGGKYASGGRGGSLYFVTNLNDRGSGSLRDAVSSGNRTIVFRVAGTITLSSRLEIQGSNLTIAGETAPGDGICVYGDGVETNSNSNIIIRHLRFRTGDGGSGEDAFRINPSSSSSVNNIILDHCSFSWGGDENFSVFTGTGGGAYASDITVQNCIISESFNDRSVLLYGQNITNVTFIGNFMANTNQRNIRCSTTYNVSYAMYNNYTYYFGGGLSATVQNRFDAIGNVWETGPASTYTDVIELVDCSTDNCPSSGEKNASGTEIHLSDNLENNRTATIDSRINSFLVNNRVINNGYAPYASSFVKSTVLANVGARATMEGVDTLDQHMIDDALNGNIGGYVSRESQTVGLPTLSSGTTYTDSDNDGIEDSWESYINGTVGTDDSNGDHDGDGYTNLEEFLHYRAKE